MRLLRCKKGITLVDTMMSMLIIAMVGAGLLSTLNQGLRGWSRGAGKEAANSAATIAAQRLSYDIRDGRSASATSTELTVTFPRLMVDPITKETAYDPTTDDPNTRIYYVSNGNLVRKIGTQTTILAKGLAADKTTFWGSANSIDAVITSRQQLGSTIWEKQATIHVALRNHCH